MIRVLAYLNEDQTNQLLEIKIERTGEESEEFSRYHCDFAVDRGDEIQIFSRWIWHSREHHNILGLIASALVGLPDDYFKLDGPIPSRPRPRTGSLFRLARGVVSHELSGRQERHSEPRQEG